MAKLVFENRIVWLTNEHRIEVDGWDNGKLLCSDDRYIWFIELDSLPGDNELATVIAESIDFFESHKPDEKIDE